MLHPVDSYQRSEKKLSKMLPPLILDQISWERFKRGSRNFTALSGTTSLTNLPDMSSLAASSQLQNAINKSIFAHEGRSCCHDLCSYDCWSCSKISSINDLPQLSWGDSQRNTTNSTRHNWDCTWQSGLLRTDQFVTSFKVYTVTTKSIRPILYCNTQ